MSTRKAEPDRATRRDRTRVLGLFGSPRRGGNTDSLLEEFLRGCKSAGAEVEALYLCRIKVQECSGCASCEETGLCRLQDEMSLFWSAFGRSTHLVFACPVYFYGVPAGAKAVIDRCQSRWSRKYRRGSNRQPGTRLRPGYFIAAAGSRGKRVFEGVRLTARYFFDAIDVSPAGELLFPGVDEKGDIRRHSTALRKSYAAGEDFVRV